MMKGQLPTGFWRRQRDGIHGKLAEPSYGSGSRDVWREASGRGILRITEASFPRRVPTSSRMKCRMLDLRVPQD